MKITRIIDIFTITSIVAIMGIYFSIMTDGTIYGKIAIPSNVSAWAILLAVSVALAVILTSVLDR